MPKEIELDENILKKNKVPLLVKDKVWKGLFEDNMTRNMKKLSKSLNELIDKEKESAKEIRRLHKQKKILMDMVLKLSDDANTNDNTQALNKLEEAKNKIIELNMKIDDFFFDMENLPKEINGVNLELLKETVSLSYSDIKNDRERVEVLDKEIKKLRQILGNMWEEKFNKEKKVDNLYSYLHGTLGHQETDKLDKRFL